jgi:hypothetical protein
VQSQRGFFGSILASQGKPCLAWLVPHAAGKPYFRHKVFDTVDQFCDALDRIDFQQYNYYFCISTLRNNSMDIKGKDRVRVQQNMLYTRCFVLDVDIRPEKEGFYADMDSALKGVQDVCAAFSLPQPTIVNSGFGLHVYWPMADGIESEVWTKAARKLKKAIELIAPMLVADGSRVSDCAGVLRIPNSFNLKSDPPTPVTVIQIYSDFVDFSVLSPMLDRIAPSDTENKAVVEIGTTFIDYGATSLPQVIKKCNWVKDYMKNQSTASEPEWYAMLGLAQFMEYKNKDGALIEREGIAHLLSRNHHDYDPEKTYLKYLQVTSAQSGPTTCAKFQAVDAKRCRGCPFLSIIKTPLQVARIEAPATEAKTVEATVVDEGGNQTVELITIPLPPKPYFRGEVGGVFVRKKVKTEEGFDDVIDRVYDYDIYPTKRLRTESTESEAMEIHLWLPKDGLKKFRLPTGYLADGKKLTQFLSDKGVVTEFNKAPTMAKYLVDYVRYLQMENAAEVEFSRFGWRDIFSAEPKFVVSDGFMTKGGAITNSGISPHLRDAAPNTAIAGSLTNWKRGFDVYRTIDESDPYILAIMLGFAAPLMPLTGYSGVMYNIVGDSAAGKSTALEVMTSVWGKPNANQLRTEDTDNAIFNFIGYLSNIPIAFDEVTKMDGDRLSTFVLAFTGGRGKMRATRDGQNRSNDIYWDTIICSTSNVSLYDKLANARRGYTAEAMRVFELHVNPSKESNKAKIDESMKLLRDNYGHAGRVFMSYIMPRIAQIKPLIEQATTAIVKKGNLRNEERFWGALLACSLVGGKIARDILKLHSYDIEGVVNRTLGFAPKVRQAVATTVSDPTSTLAEFINANLNSLIRINDGNVDLTAMNGNMNNVKGRLEYKEGVPHVGYISVQSIREYCDQRRIDNAWLRRELVELGVIKDGMLQKRLTAGTKLPQVNVKVWEVALQHEKLCKSLEDITNVE